jgi:predicted nucleic acid-binding protein
LADVFDRCAVVELGAGIAQAAGDASERFALRAYDAVHLASALAVAEGTTVLLTWDEQLSAAGRLAGLDVVP